MEESLKNFQMDSKESNYNDEPVHYCSECLSLKTFPYDNHTDYCGECGSTEIKEAHIEEWEKLYEEKYKVKYLNKK